VKFGRRKGADEDAPDPAEWAPPADAGVTTEQPVVAPETAAGGAASPEPLSAAALTAPAAGLDAEPAAVAAAQEASTASASGFGPGTSEPSASTASSTSGAAEPASSPSSPGGLGAILDNPTLQQRPEIAIAGAFAGAFVLAKILRRITE
jgi:hypothetical protein